MPRQNRVDPWSDLHAVSDRGTFTGNRGCLVDDTGRLTRHHRGRLWITCVTRFRDWEHPLAQPKTWTPLFFLDDAVALAAGHRPCGLCRRDDYLAFRAAVTAAAAAATPLLAPEINERLAAERLRPGRGLQRKRDRILWTAELDALPPGVIIAEPPSGITHLVTEEHIQPFDFDGWGVPVERPRGLTVAVLTPPTSVSALENGFIPLLHPTAAGADLDRGPQPAASRTDPPADSPRFRGRSDRALDL